MTWKHGDWLALAGRVGLSFADFERMTRAEVAVYADGARAKDDDVEMTAAHMLANLSLLWSTGDAQAEQMQEWMSPKVRQVRMNIERMKKEQRREIVGLARSRRLVKKGGMRGDS